MTRISKIKAILKRKGRIYEKKINCGKGNNNLQLLNQFSKITLLNFQKKTIMSILVKVMDRKPIDNFLINY